MKTNKINDVLAGFTGRYDNMVFYDYRGMKCVRSMPEEVKAPSSPGQLAQQARVASIAIFYRALKEAGLYGYWRKATEGRLWNGYNLLVKSNLPAFDAEGRICDFAKLRISAGSVALPDGLECRPGEAGEWVLAWRNTPGQPNAALDACLRLFAVRDAETFRLVPIDAGGACRRDEEAVFRLPEDFTENAHVYVFFCSMPRGGASESRYCLIHKM